MNCRQALPLLESLVDNELPEAETARLKSHINDCNHCRQGYQETIHLREILSRNRVMDPGPQYWTETTSLILARTTELADKAQVHHLPQKTRHYGQVTIIRSIMSVVASITILCIALLIGSSLKKQNVVHYVKNAPLLATTDLRDLLQVKDHPIYTAQDQINLARGALLLGMPGSLGRFAGLSDLFLTIDLK